MHLRRSALVCAYTVALASVISCDSTLYLGRDDTTSFAGANGGTRPTYEGGGSGPKTARAKAAGMTGAPAGPSAVNDTSSPQRDDEPEMRDQNENVEEEDVEEEDVEEEDVEEEVDSRTDAEADDDAGL